MIVICNACGVKNLIDHKYCKECGKKITVDYRTMTLSAFDLKSVSDPQSKERLTRLLDMAFWHNQSGNVDAAITACKAALDVNPESTTAHSLLGTLYERKGEDFKAIEQFEAVLALNPESEADAHKLEQIRLGIRVQPTVQPHTWISPLASGKLLDSLQKKMADIDLSGHKVGGLKLALVASSVLIGIIFFAIGLAVLRNPSSVDARSQAKIIPPTAVATVNNNSAFAQAVVPAAPVKVASAAPSPIAASKTPVKELVLSKGPDPFDQSNGATAR